MLRIIATVALAVACVFGLTACPTSGDARDDNQGLVSGRSEKPDTRTGKPWVYLTITLNDGTTKHETYTDKAEVGNCTVGTVWPRCVGK